MAFGATLCKEVQNYVFDLEESQKKSSRTSSDRRTVIAPKVHAILGLHQAWTGCVPILGKVHSFPSTKLNLEGTYDRRIDDH